MRTFLPRVMLAAVAATVVLPAVFTPAQAAPWSLSSSSSSSLGGSSLSSIFEELTDEEIVVDLPGYGEYRFPADLTLASLNPDNADPVDLFSAAVFAADYEDNADARQAALAALEQPQRAQVTAALTALHGEVAPPETASARAPIVVLGNGLNPDGSLHPNLENRLLAATELAKRRPGAPIVVSGGLLVGGYVEAHAMRDWLVEEGVAEGRILVEDRSFSTVSNARFTRELLPEATDVIVVTSRDHVHRAVVDFTLAFGPDAQVAGVGAPNDPPTALSGQRGIYLDVMKWYLG